jgi:hypothetical protein
LRIIVPPDNSAKTLIGISHQFCLGGVPSSVYSFPEALVYESPTNSIFRVGGSSGGKRLFHYQE